MLIFSAKQLGFFWSQMVKGLKRFGEKYEDFFAACKYNTFDRSVHTGNLEYGREQEAKLI